MKKGNLPETEELLEGLKIFNDNGDIVLITNNYFKLSGDDRHGVINEIMKWCVEEQKILNDLTKEYILDIIEKLPKSEKDEN